MHSIKLRKKQKKGAMSIKLDMSKAYERVEWSFVQGMLLKLGFQQSWVDLILECISSVSYTVAVNGDRSENFFPGRGLRQGDPLSPYLFLICADGFSALPNQAAKVNRLVGVSAG